MKRKNKYLLLASLMSISFVGKVTNNYILKNNIVLEAQTSNININEKNPQKLNDVNINKILTKYSNKGNVTYIIRKDNQVVSKNANTKYQIGSQTKMFTALVIFKLIEEHKLKLDDTLSSILKNDPNLNYYKNVFGKDYSNVTIESLLTHKSGLPDYLNWKDSNNFSISDQKIFDTLKNDQNKVFKIKDIFDLIKNHNNASSASEPMKAPRNSYSNTGYYTLGLIIEKLTHKDLSTVYKEYIWNKLSMKDTSLKVFVHGHMNGNSEIFSNTSLTWSAGGATSTATDMQKFMYALYQKDNKLLSTNSYNNWFNVSKNRSYIHGAGYAEVVPGSFGHSGQSFGYLSDSFYNPQDKTFVIVSVDEAEANTHSIVYELSRYLKSISTGYNLPQNLNHKNVVPNKVQNNKKGWGHNADDKWIWYTGKGEELFNKPGWQKWKGSWLFENKNRTYATSEWKKVNGKWYYFSKYAYISRGWKKVSGKWYHFAWSGKMDTKGWHKIGGKWYYMNKDGDLYTKNGWWKSNSGKWMYSKGANGYATNERIGKYNFDSNGYME